MNTIPIISLQISDELHERFEKVRNISGFTSKSEALREAIVNFIESHEKFEKLEGYKIMVFSLLYPIKEALVNEISDTYSRFQSIIKSISDWRIAEKKVEIVVVVGEFGLIKDLKTQLESLKEVTCSVREIVIE